MPRVRELVYGRTAKWSDRMSERFTQGDGTELDMGDPASIRIYVRKQLARYEEPSPFALQRLKLMLEVADSLPPKPQSESLDGPGRVVLLEPSRAAAELIRRRGLKTYGENK